MYKNNLFRGKPTEEYKDFLMCWKEHCKDGFVYGSLVVTADNRCFICVSALCSHKSIINNGITTMCEVIPETVGQYIGTTDKNGTKIFEGDIVALRSGRPYEVKYNNGGFELVGTAIPIRHIDKFEVVGNKHDIEVMG